MLRLRAGVDVRDLRAPSELPLPTLLLLLLGCTCTLQFIVGSRERLKDKKDGAVRRGWIDL